MVPVYTFSYTHSLCWCRGNRQPGTAGGHGGRGRWKGGNVAATPPTYLQEQPPVPSEGDEVPTTASTVISKAFPSHESGRKTCSACPIRRSSLASMLRTDTAFACFPGSCLPRVSIGQPGLSKELGLHYVGSATGASTACSGTSSTNPEQNPPPLVGRLAMGSV